jgi:hypothetical protein
MKHALIAVLLGLMGFAVGMTCWYVSMHPFMAYQREVLAKATPAGLRRGRIALFVVTLFLTLTGVLIGIALPG